MDAELESLRADLRKVIAELAHQGEVVESMAVIVLQLGKRLQDLEAGVARREPQEKTK